MAVANRCQVAPSQQLQNCHLQKVSHRPPPDSSCFVCCDKFVLVLAGDLLGIIEKNHCFLWLTFFLLDLLLEMCTVRCCSEEACCPPWDDSWGNIRLSFFGEVISVLLLLKALISESTSFQVTFLLSPCINGFISSHGEGLWQKRNTTTYREIIYYNYCSQIMLEYLITGNRNQLGLP